MSYIRLSYDETTLIEFNGSKLKMKPYLPHLTDTPLPHFFLHPHHLLPSNSQQCLLPSPSRFSSRLAALALPGHASIVATRRHTLLLPCSSRDPQAAAAATFLWLFPRQQQASRPRTTTGSLGLTCVTTPPYQLFPLPSMVIEVVHKLFYLSIN